MNGLRVVVAMYEQNKLNVKFQPREAQFRARQMVQ
jgi:hypothetical protein